MVGLTSNLTAQGKENVFEGGSNKHMVGGDVSTGFQIRGYKRTNVRTSFNVNQGDN